MRNARIPLALALVVLAGLTTGSSVAPTKGARNEALARALDVRSTQPAMPPTTGQVKAIAAMVNARPDTVVRWNARFGTPSSILSYDRTLTGAAPGSPWTAARSWLRSHAGVFGWDRPAIAALRPVKLLTQPNGGPRILLFHQVFGGLEGGGFGGSLVVGVDDFNRILSIRANVVRVPSRTRGSHISASDALARALGRAAPRQVGTRAGFIEFAPGKLGGPHFARLIAFPMGVSRARTAWEVHTTEKIDVADRVVVDAATGEILYRHSRVFNEAPEGRVFLNHPGAPKGGTHEMASFAGDPKASPEGWLGPAGSLPLTTTTGNNAVTATAWVAGIVAPDGPGEVRAVGINGVFDYAFNNAWKKSNCGGPTGLEPSWALDSLPASVSLFYHHNVAHDFWYRLGFDEQAGAMQLSNFGKTGPESENDPLLGLVQASPLAASNNAYMSTNADGLPSYSGMFLFSSPFPCVDGDFDSEVIYHEYAHAVTNRWVGAEFGNLDTHQGGSMGESWGDFVAVHYLHSIGVETRDALGPYVTGDDDRGIRNWGLSKVQAHYGDVGYDYGPAVHSDGEIWSGALWDLRQTLAKARKNGAGLAMQIVADAMPLSGPSPSMLDMRDAILAADRARTKGANQSTIWTVFARHGMGFSASTIDGNDTDPVPAFDVKDPGSNGTLTGRIIDAFSGLPVPFASIVIGAFEVGITPITQTATDGTFRLRLAEGPHVLTIRQRGYGSQKIRIAIKAGQKLSGDLLISPNFASWNTGARPLGGNEAAVQAARDAIDDTEGSLWVPSSERHELIVKLGGAAPVEIAGLSISSLGGGGSALKDWEFLVSDDGKTFRPAARGAFGKGRLGAAVNDLTYRPTRLSRPMSARYVKLVAKSLQSDTATSLAVAELQIFGRAGGFEAKPVKLKAFHNDGMAIVPVPAGFVFASPTSLTEYVMGFVCAYPPPTQGIDAVVTELPEEFADGTVSFKATAESLGPEPQLDADVTFLDKDCARLSASASASATESGVIPSGTRYVVHHLFLNVFPTRLSFDIAGGTTVSISPAPAVKVGGTKQTRPKVDPRLPATGVAGYGSSGMYALTASFGLAVWLGVGSRIRRVRRRAI